MDFKQCEYVFNRGAKKGVKCSAKTLNQYCKKHSKTKGVQKITEIPIDNGKEEIKIQEVNEEESKKKV